MNTRNDITEIDPAKLIRMQSLHVAFILFDVRALGEFEKGHIKGAVCLQVFESGVEFVRELAKVVPKKDTPVVIYDNDGIKSGDLVLEAEQNGFINIVNLEGGYQAYLTAQPASSVAEPKIR